MNKRISHLFQHRVKRKKGDTAQLAAQLAPLEEQKPHHAPEPSGGAQGAIHPGATQEYGAIVVGNENLRLSDDLIEGKTPRGIFGMEPVVLAILVFMLAFIVFIAWQVSLMPRSPE
jgi:hypothetical protein